MGKCNRQKGFGSGRDGRISLASSRWKMPVERAGPAKPRWWWGLENRRKSRKLMSTGVGDEKGTHSWGDRCQV